VLMLVSYATPDPLPPLSTGQQRSPLPPARQSPSPVLLVRHVTPTANFKSKFKSNFNLPRPPLPSRAARWGRAASRQKWEGFQRRSIIIIITICAYPRVQPPPRTSHARTPTSDNGRSHVTARWMGREPDLRWEEVSDKLG
jgi:hypothetical protein